MLSCKTRTLIFMYSLIFGHEFFWYTRALNKGSCTHMTLTLKELCPHLSFKWIVDSNHQQLDTIATISHICMECVHVFSKTILTIGCNPPHLNCPFLKTQKINIFSVYVFVLCYHQSMGVRNLVWRSIKAQCMGRPQHL